MSSSPYNPSGVARHRALEQFAWFNTGSNNRPPPMPIQRAKIIQVRQEENTVDIRLTDGSIVRHVSLASNHAGTNHGSYRTPKVKNYIDDMGPEGSLDTYQKTGERDQFVMVAYLGGLGADDIQRPVIIGSILPQVNHLTNDSIGSIDRTPYDNTELFLDDEHHTHYTPDFSGVTTGPNPDKFYPAAHDPGMEGPPDFDKKWKVINEGDKTFFISMHQQAGQNTIIFNPDGRFQIHKGDGAGGTSAAVEIHPNGHITTYSASGHTMDVPHMTITGNLYVNGNISTPNNINGGNIQSPAGGVPGPPGGAGAPGVAGPVTPHDYPMAATPKNPLTGKRP